MAENGHDKIRQVDTSAPAIMIRVASQAGPRAIEMTFGVPLDMTLKDLNSYVDKVVSVADRLQNQGELQRAKADLDGAEKALATHIEQRAAYEARETLAWDASGRKGAWRPTDSQRQQLRNWETSIAEMRDKRIPHFRAEIAKLEREIAAGV